MVKAMTKSIGKRPFKGEALGYVIHPDGIPQGTCILLVSRLSFCGAVL